MLCLAWGCAERSAEAEVERLGTGFGQAYWRLRDSPGAWSRRYGGGVSRAANLVGAGGCAESAAGLHPVAGRLRCIVSELKRRLPPGFIIPT